MVRFTKQQVINSLNDNNNRDWSNIDVAELDKAKKLANKIKKYINVDSVINDYFLRNNINIFKKL